MPNAARRPGILTLSGTRGLRVPTEIRDSLDSPSVRRALHNTTSTGLKITISYLQCVSLARGLEVRWPAVLFALFSAQQAAGSFGGQVASVSCLVTDVAGSFAVDTFYLNVLMYVLLPFLAMTMVLAYWGIKYACMARSLPYVAGPPPLFRTNALTHVAVVAGCGHLPTAWRNGQNCAAR